MRNRTAQKVAPRSPQERPRASQDASRTPPGRPQIAPRPPKTLPRRPPDPHGHPQDPQRRLPDPPGRPKRLFRSTWPNTLFRKNRKNQPRLFSEGGLCTAVVGKIEKIEIVERCRINVEKKSTMFIHGGHSTQSLAKIESPFATVEPPEGGGGGRAKRSSIRRPQRSTACCKSPGTFLVQVVFSSTLKLNTFAESI